ncbi:MAG: energy transducer TonB [Fusobacteriaceae bacterium]
MKKNDIFSLLISAFINLFLILLFGLSITTNSGKLKVGLVALDNQNDVEYQGQKEVDGPIPPEIPPEPITEPEIEKKPNPTKEINLDKLDSISIDKPKLSNISDKGVKINQKSKPSLPNPDVEYMEAPIKTSGSKPGVPSGYKLGTQDGDIIANWNQNNRDPEYPQSAQLQGLNGTVTLKLTIDRAGNVKNVVFVKKSGVSAIDLAIEKVARTWKINLTKKSKIISGDVILEYKFKLGND